MHTGVPGFDFDTTKREKKKKCFFLKIKQFLIQGQLYLIYLLDCHLPKHVYVLYKFLIFDLIIFILINDLLILYIISPTPPK